MDYTVPELRWICQILWNWSAYTLLFLNIFELIWKHHIFKNGGSNLEP